MFFNHIYIVFLSCEKAQVFLLAELNEVRYGQERIDGTIWVECQGDSKG